MQLSTQNYIFVTYFFKINATYRVGINRLTKAL